MDDLYRDEILEHYRNPHTFGMLAEPDKWDWRITRGHVLPMLENLSDTLARYAKEIDEHGQEED